MTETREKQNCRFEDDTEIHFPTTVMQRQHDGLEGLNQRLFQMISEMQEKFADTEDNAVKSGEISTQGGYQTSTKMNLFTLEHPAIVEFREQIIMPAAHEYLRQVFGNEARQLDPWPVGWSNVLGEGDWQGPHNHPTDKNVASGVYYVQLPDDKPSPQGCIEFINPIPESVHHGFPATRRLEPKEGLMVWFPPYYTHYVHPFHGPGTRVIIAFDLLAQRPGMQFVF
jgi:uncharacterized protein (TIGR02466 family)